MEKFIIIEKMDPNFPVIATMEDGTPMMFFCEEDAQDFLQDFQNPQIVKLT